MRPFIVTAIIGFTAGACVTGWALIASAARAFMAWWVGWL